MKNKKYKTLIAATVITGVLGSCMGCNTNTGEYSSSGRDSVESSVFSSFEEEKKWNTIGEGDQLIERPLIDDEEREEFLRDLNFSRGFGVSAFHANTSGGIPVGYLDYDGLKADGEDVWSVGQWGCTKSLMDAEFERNGSVIGYFDGSKTLRFDVAKTGSIALGIKGSVEYGKDEEGNYRDRLEVTENWPHNIIGQGLSGEVKGSERIMWEVSYTVTECARLTEYPVNAEMHAAQFQWFVSMYNKNPDTESYGQSVWFGFSMFDTRSMNSCPAGMAAYDGGKEDNTGMFIYMFSLSQVDDSLDYNVVDKPSSVVGQRRNVAVDVLPFIKAGIISAQKKGALKGASWEDMVFNSTNIGWEIPGSYDVSVDIHSMNMYKVKK